MTSAAIAAPVTVTVPDRIPLESVTVLTTTVNATSKAAGCWVTFGKVPPFGFPQ